MKDLVVDESLSACTLLACPDRISGRWSNRKSLVIRKVYLFFFSSVMVVLVVVSGCGSVYIFSYVEVS